MSEQTRESDTERDAVRKCVCKCGHYHDETGWFGCLVVTCPCRVFTVARPEGDLPWDAEHNKAKKTAWKSSIFATTELDKDLRRTSVVRGIYNEAFDAGYLAHQSEIDGLKSKSAVGCTDCGYEMSAVDDEVMTCHRCDSQEWEQMYRKGRSEIDGLRGEVERWESVIDQLAYYTSLHSDAPCGCDQCNIYKIVEAALKEKYD